MKDISLSRHYFSVFALGALAVIAGLLPLSADAQPQGTQLPALASPYVGTVSAKEIYRQYAIQERRTERHGSADSLATPLARIRSSRAAAMSRASSLATNSTDTISSTVQTQDYTLPLEDVDSSGNEVAPSTLTGTGANIDPAWFPDESYIAYSSNHSGDGYYHLFALPATGIDTSNANASTKLASRLAQLSQMTADASAAPRNERWPSFASSTQIAYCQSAGTSVNGPYSLVVAPIITNGATNLPIVDQAHASVVVPASGITGQIASVERSVYLGNVIIFSAIKVGDSAYHLFEYTLSTQTITQLTTGAADEENPSAIETPSGQSVIVFDSTATGYPSTTTSLPLTSNGAHSDRKRNIFAITTSATGAVQVTNNSADSLAYNSLEPSLGYVTANQSSGIGEGVHLFFSSNRVNNHYNLYDLAVTIPINGTPALAGFEASGNTPKIVLTSDPEANDSAATPEPVGGFDNLEPAAPPFINFNTVLFVSARYLVNNIGDNPVSNGAYRYNAPLLTTDFQGATVDTEQQPDSTPSSPGGVFAQADTLPAKTQTLVPAGSFDIMSSHDADIDAPTLLRYNSNEIIHITTSDNVAAPDVRQPGTGQTIYFFVRLSDRQTGVGKAFLQIKNPNSAYQDLAGLEHKVFTKDTTIVEPASDTFLHPGSFTNAEYFNEAQSLYYEGGAGAVAGFDSAGASIGLGNLRQATPSGYVAPMRSDNLLNSTDYVYANQPPTTTDYAKHYYKGGPIASFAAAASGTITLTVTGSDFLKTIYSQRPQNGQPVFNNDGSVAQTNPNYDYNLALNSQYSLAGCTLDLYSTGGTYQETVQVIRSAVTTAAGTSGPEVSSLTVTPLHSAYVAPTTAPTTTTIDGKILYGPPLFSAAGFAVVSQVGYFDPQGVEVDAQAIQAGTGTKVDASNPNNFTIPTYVAGLDDLSPYSGLPAPTDPTNGNNLWVTLSPVGPDDVNGGILYEGSWTTPDVGSDWYIDAIAYDNALNNVYNTQSSYSSVNWRIYDNVWGFSTRPFVAHTSPGGILLVNDYMLPQKFLSQGVSAGNAPVAYFGAESYLTDVDVDPQDFGNAQQLASLPDTGYTVEPVTGVITLSPLYHRPSSLDATGNRYSNAPYYPNGLGVNSYYDGEQNTVTRPVAAPTFPVGANQFSGSIVAEGSYPNNAPAPPSQSYDIWRILCRGPLPASILNDYSPVVVNQHADVTNGEPAKTVLSAPSCVIWSAPLAGEEFADSGTIADPNTEALLQTFVAGGTDNNITFQGGGRLYVEGTTVGITTSANQGFYTGLLGATYKGQTEDSSSNTFTLSGGSNRTDYISYDAYVNHDGSNDVEDNRIGHAGFKALEDGLALDSIPNWMYEPPADTAGTGSFLRLAFLSIGTDRRSDASLIDGGSSPVIFIDTFTDAYTMAPPAGDPTTGLLPDTAAQASELMAASGNRLSYVSFAPPPVASPSGGSTVGTVDSGSGIVAYSSFGLESVSQNVRATQTPLTQYGTMPPDDPSFAVDNQRSDLLHNLVCFLRTGSIQGQVTVGNSNTSGTVTPIANALVSASIQAQGGVDAPTQTYTAVTGQDGRFRILGLPPGKYGLTGYAPGYSFSQINGTGVYVHGGDIGTDNFQAAQTQPGSLSVTVLDPNTDQGVSSVTVTAYEAGSYGQVGDQSYTGITGASGTATISNIPTGSYVVVATPPSGSAYSATVYVSSTGTTTTIGTTTYTPVSVTASTTTSITITLSVAGATISGTVTSSNGPVAGATVTFTNTNTAKPSPASVITGSDGTYTVNNVQQGTYTPTATATGFMTDTLASLTVVSAQIVTGENFTLAAPQFGVIEGAVDDATGNLASGVSVILTGTGFMAQTRTTGAAFPDNATPANNDNIAFQGIPYGTYTVTAQSATGNVSKTVTLSSSYVTFPTIQLPSVHAFTYPSGVANVLQMISAPYDYTNTGDTLAELFGYANPKITTWLPLSNAYAVPGVSPADTLHLGVGYWVRFPATENLLIAGTPITSNTYPVILYTGWNMIGEPFVTTTGESVSSLTITTSSGTYPFATASGNQLQLVGPTLYTYLPGDTSYETVTSSGRLNEYQGYWIHALTNCTLNFVRP